MLSLDPNFAEFLVDGRTWEKKTANNPLRGFVDDGETVPATKRKTASQKVAQLELMLGQIANFCPVISRNTIVKQSTSIPGIWQAIRLHFGFQSSGSHLLDFADIKLESDERPEDLYQRIVAFVEASLLRRNGGISHHGDVPTADEDMSPTLENLITRGENSLKYQPAIRASYFQKLLARPNIYRPNSMQQYQPLFKCKYVCRHA